MKDKKKKNKKKGDQEKGEIENFFFLLVLLRLFFVQIEKLLKSDSPIRIEPMKPNRKKKN